MNNIANSLLHLLLSWMRTLFGDVLSLTQNGGAGMIAWLSKRWIPLAVILVLAGIILDAFVYLIRWRPQYVWRTRLRHIFRRRDNDGFDEREFDQGFDTALPDFNFGDTPIADLSTAPVPEPMLDSYFAQPAISSVNDQPEPLVDASVIPAERKRRSDRHSRRVRLPVRSDSSRRRNTEAPMNPRAAFHDPVYPAAEYPREENKSGEFQDV